MQLAELTGVVMQALELALWLSAPALIASFLAGAASGVLQAATQVQDPGLSFLPRLLAVAAALLVTGSLMGDRMVAFTSELFRGLAR